MNPETMLNARAIHEQPDAVRSADDPDCHFVGTLAQRCGITTDSCLRAVIRTHTNIWRRGAPRKWATIPRHEDDTRFQEADLGQITRFAIGIPTMAPVRLVRTVQAKQRAAGNASFYLNCC
jgi:hypothetical protein